MGTLDRYQKTGGFLQLLTLIESCTPDKKEKFLKMIRDEDPRWANAIQQKMITLPIVLTWDPEVFNEVAGVLQDLTVAVAMHGIDPSAHEKFTQAFTSQRKRKVQELYETNKPLGGDIATAHLKILSEVRKLAHEGVIRFEKFAPNLVIEENIEENLRKGLAFVYTNDSHDDVTEPMKPIPAEAFATPGTSADSKVHDELAALRKKLAQSAQENQTLRQELNQLRHKIDQIKKIC